MVVKKAFTLAEVLITLAIIGVVAALTIPSVVANTQQQEFKTGLRKAVSVLNSAITMNMAVDGETPYDTWDLYGYLMRHMSIMKSGVASQMMCHNRYTSDGVKMCNHNTAFYTTDGMRFEFRMYDKSDEWHLYENPDVALRGGGFWSSSAPFNTEGLFTAPRQPDYCKNNPSSKCGKCGSYGLINNTNNTVNPPCFIVVDVNGDRKPFPQNASCYQGRACNEQNVRKYGDSKGRKLTDTFMIMITESSAIPYGQAAQKAMYEAQK